MLLKAISSEGIINPRMMGDINNMNAPDIDVTSIHYNASTVDPGGLFVAIEGFKTDGHLYIGEAVERGAAAVVAQKPAVIPIPVISVENTRKALAALADHYYGNPSKRLFIIGVTGTNGKTTTAFLIGKILQHAGLNTGIIGTLDYRYNGKTFDNPVTTPESLDLQRILADMAAEGVTHVVSEISSHAIALSRIDFCRIDMGVFTNFSQDHLDFHGDMHRYWQCKKKLFTDYLNQEKKGQAVINTNSREGEALAAGIPYPVVTTGSSEKNMVHPKSISLDLNGIHGELTTPSGSLHFDSPLIGAYNLENILSASGVGAMLNLPPEVIKSGIEDTRAVPGRLERVSNHEKRAVYVDYAHTPDALRNVLGTLKNLNPQRMICIFGCGGDRDKGKRPLMGEIAAEICNLVIVTSDNPRTEDPAEIIDQIILGVRKICRNEYKLSEIQNGFDLKGYCVEQNRKTAIRAGIQAAKPGDIVLLAGKGHETYQIVGKTSIPFDDRIEAKNILADIEAKVACG